MSIQEGKRPLMVAADEAGIAVAVAALASGDLVGLPTETVYGLAADGTDGRAVAGIYAAKGRPAFNPLILHVAGREAAERIGRFDADARRLADAFWPGPLTLVVPVRPEAGVAELALAGLSSVALRVPAHPAALAVLTRFGRPVAAPSANPSGRISPTTAADVARDLGASVAVILDGGPTEVGVESTIVACLGGPPAVLRPGGVIRSDLLRTVGTLSAAGGTGAIVAPGMLASHYAPAARVRLGAVDAAGGEAVLDFGCALSHTANRVRGYLDLSPSGDLREAAARLFQSLRILDSGNPSAIAVAQLPVEGLGEAILDRLGRAAAPRESANDERSG
jgi:L-threonylcarbamoyladenylate synthase